MFTKTKKLLKLLFTRQQQLKSRYLGTVRYFNKQKGYGFITADHDKVDIFIHIRTMKVAGINIITPNQRIEYDVIEKRGKKEVTNIRLI